MLSRLSRSLSFRLLAIFVILGGLFVLGTINAIQRFYNSDQIRGLISGHLSLHVQYVRDDIGVPPRIEIFLSSSAVKYPTHSPSGEKNGWRASSVASTASKWV